MKFNSFMSSVVIMLVMFCGVGNPSCRAVDSNGFSNAAMEFNRANPKMLWGETTNFVGGTPFSSSVTNSKPLPKTLRVGLNARDGMIILSGHPLKIVHPADLYVFTDSIDIWLGIPPFNERAIVSMADSNGVPVPKTDKGFLLGQPLTLKPKTTAFDWGGNNRNPWIKVFSIAPYGIMTIDTRQKGKSSPNDFGFVFDPTRYFSIKKPGVYQLTLAIRLYVVDTNRYLTPITLPPVNLPVRVEGDSD